MRTPDYAARIKFHDAQDILEVDFSDVTFSDTVDVDQFYDEIDRRLEASGRPWFFLVNYQNCKILPDAWVSFAKRGKRCNLEFSRGTARFQPHEQTGREIAEKAKKDEFDPNLFGSRQAAVDHLRALRQSAEGLHGTSSRKTGAKPG